MPVKQELAAVERLLVEQLASRVDLAETIGRHIVGAGGKRLRPLVVLLTAGTCSSSSEQHIPLAAALEFLHTATLLHDDVVDHSSRRRGRNTANATWGNAASVLVGDFLYSRTFQLLVSTKNLRVLDCMAQAGAALAEGEVHQLTQAGNHSLSEEEYLEIITAKTGTLFEAAARSSALLAGADDEHIDRMARYGCSLGIAFQIMDDILDYLGVPEHIGKNSGDDLDEGKMTLPLIYALRQADSGETQLLREILTAENIGGTERLVKVVEVMESCGAIEQAIEQAQKYRDRAQAALHAIPSSPFRNALASLADLAVTRSA